VTPTRIMSVDISVVSKDRGENWELTDNAVAFIGCRSRLIIMLAGAARGEKGNGKVNGC
jgi:hypothetical protein